MLLEARNKRRSNHDQRGLILQCAAGETARVWLQGDTIVVLTDLAPIALLP